MRIGIFAVLGGCFVFSMGALAAPGAAAPEAVAPPFKKVMIVIFENAGYESALAQPFFAQLARQGALLANFHAEAHPSQPNYIALVSGSTAGVTGDGNVNVSRRHIGDLLEAQGKSWKVYAESYPGNCFQGARSGTYARKHVPFISFTNVQLDPSRCARIVDASELATDIQNGTVPDFSLYIPDMNNDGHDTGVAYADRWMSQSFAPLLQDRRLMQGMLVVATFDENDFSEPTNHIYAALIGDSVAAGSVSQTSYDHYSLLRTIEDTLGLGNLGLNDASATPIAGIWAQSSNPVLSSK